MLNTKISVDVFDPRDFLNDPRVAFDLVGKGEKYECTLCGHRFDYSNRAVEQLKGVHLRKASHLKAMKDNLGISTSSAAKQPQISSFFKPVKNSDWQSEEWDLDMKEQLLESGEMEKAHSSASGQKSPRASFDDSRRAEIKEILRKNKTSVAEIGRLFFVPCEGSMPSAASLGIDTDFLPEDPLTPFMLHPVASKEKTAIKFRNMNKYGFHTEKCNLFTTDREKKCNLECSSVGMNVDLINLIKKSSEPKNRHNLCNSIGHTIARTSSTLSRNNLQKKYKRALEKISRIKSRDNTFNEVLALISQNEMGIAYKVLSRFGNNPSKLLEMTKKILEFNHRPYLGNEDSTLIKKYMMISIMAGSQTLQVLSYFDYQSQHFPKSIREKVLAQLKIQIPLSNVLPTEHILNQVLELIQQDIERKNVAGPFIVTTAEDEVKLDEAIEYDLRGNRVVGFAVDTFSSEINDIADTPKVVDNLDKLVSNAVIVPADLDQRLW